ncbi:MAG: cysteine desulfurase NifS [Thermoplasmata archaeon M9B1D]|nr:MAG: cysteine desulfurase NifS [Thermoplasmata archaeon M8B2D]PNX48893.1 MAG: cysteine desulfurase NifS [Thermoplasmata archaeon M9B1D]
MKKVYLDYGATTPVDKDVLNEILPFFHERFGNASSIHSYGKEAFDAVENAREKVSDIINCKANEIVFTSGGTESDNLAIKGVAYINKDKRKTKGNHIITSAIEHPAVLETCRHLEKQGFNVKYLPVDKYGIVNTKDLEDAISANTFLVTIMYANNEIGTVEPIEELGKITKEHNVLFHTDAVQAITKISIDVIKLNIDLLSVSAHKIYGPKGTGALYVKNGIKLEPTAHGGGHEKGLRSSTLNTPGIVGIGKACEIGKKRMKKDTFYMKILRDKLIKNVLEIEESYLNGHPEKRLANNAHFRFTAVEGESLNLMLDDKGIAAATGSACSSKKLQTSHVLLAIGVNPKEAHGSIRFTLGKYTSKEEIEYVSDALPEIVKRLRKMSPLWNR